MSSLRKSVNEGVRLRLASKETGYLAGLLDADGYIGLCKAGRLGRTQYGLRVVITSACQELVCWIQATTGLGKVSHFTRSHQGRKDSHQWRVFGAEAGVFLGAVGPYLRVKSAQAIIALGYQRNRVLTGPARNAFGKQCSELLKSLNSAKKHLP